MTRELVRSFLHDGDFVYRMDCHLEFGWTRCNEISITLSIEVLSGELCYVAYVIADRMVDAVFARLRSHSKLERDAAISEMQTMIASTDFSAKERVATEIERLLSDENNWESRHGGLAASLLILGLPNDEFKSYGSHFGKMLHSKAVELLNDEENRVRTSAGKCKPRPRFFLENFFVCLRRSVRSLVRTSGKRNLRREPSTYFIHY